jgi:hypothetical protein
MKLFLGISITLASLLAVRAKARALVCEAGLAPNIEWMGCEPCPKGSYKGDNDAACRPCDPGFKCDYVPVLGGEGVAHNEYDTGGKEEDYEVDERYYKQFNCTSDEAFMYVKINTMDVYKPDSVYDPNDLSTRSDYLILSNQSFLSTFVPDQDTVGGYPFLYVGSGNGVENKNLLRDLPLLPPSSNLYLMFYSYPMSAKTEGPGEHMAEGEVTDKIVVKSGFDFSWTCIRSGATEQHSCDIGEYSLKGATECTVCEVGHYCPTTKESLPCPPGTFSTVSGSVSRDACLPCPAGTYTNAGASLCFACEDDIRPLEGFDMAFNCTSIVPSPASPSVAIQNAAYHTILTRAKIKNWKTLLDKSPCLTTHIDVANTGVHYECDSKGLVVSTDAEILKSPVSKSAAKTLIEYLPYFSSVEKVIITPRQEDFEDRPFTSSWHLSKFWSTLTNLKEVDLNGLGMSGSLPSEWCTLTKLKYVDLGGNNLTSPLPEVYAFFYYIIYPFSSSLSIDY